jgi:hypothetical protein
MTPETIDLELQALKETHGEVSTAAGLPGQVLLRIEKAILPAGCKPAETSVLLVLHGGQRPALYVEPGIRLPNGAVPRSTSSVQVAGVEWMQFSYTFPYDENTHTLVQFVETSLRRFAKAE